MKSQKLGTNISVEVSGITPHGLWLFAKDKEYFLSYKEFPWFKKAIVSDIHNVKLMHNHFLHWPSLDVDLELESLSNTEQYPLKYRS